MHIQCMVMHDVQNEFPLIFYQLGTLSPLPSGEKEVSQTPHCPGSETVKSLPVTPLQHQMEHPGEDLRSCGKAKTEP